MENPRINVTFDEKTYMQIKLIAEKRGSSMSEVCRLFILDSLNGELTKENIDFVSSIIREQLKIVLHPSIERLAALSAKTCMQASTSAYLTAETIARFVPEDLQMDVQDAYNAARKKAVQYIRQSPANPDTEDTAE